MPQIATDQGPLLRESQEGKGVALRVLPGGAMDTKASMEALVAQGLKRPAKEPWCVGEDPKALKAYELISRAFPDFTFEVVHFWDPKRRRVTPESERVWGFWGSKRGRWRYLTAEDIFDGDRVKPGIRLHNGPNGPRMCAMSRNGTPLRTFVRFDNYPTDAKGNRYPLTELVAMAKQRLSAS